MCWEGRPAPRAFTFRNWRWSAGALLAGLTALATAAVVTRAGLSLPGPGALPVFAMLFLWGTIGHLIYARMAWEYEFYALTDRRLLVESGLFRRGFSACGRKDLDGVLCRSMGASLATVSLGRRGGRRPVKLHCLEHPELLLKELREVGK